MLCLQRFQYDYPPQQAKTTSEQCETTLTNITAVLWVEL